MFSTRRYEIIAVLVGMWRVMKSYDESGGSWMVVIFLVGAVLLSGFNIWRKVRRKMRDTY